MLPKICVVDDGVELQTLLKEALLQYQLSSALTLAEARTVLNSTAFDLILLDVRMPDGSGFEFCSELRSNPQFSTIPIIFLTGELAPVDQATGFSMGADDYVVKPFSIIELRARIDARLRARNAALVPTELVVGQIRFDRVRNRAYGLGPEGEKDLGLTPFEFRLLHFLASSRGKVFARQDLLKNVMEKGITVNEGTLYTHISALRRKMRGLSTEIECIPRVGYCLK